MEMGENDHQSSEWSIGIDQENNLEEVLEPATACCIYKVPPFFRNINEKAYTPKLISIGPFHYCRKDLMEMENHKTRYWSKFWERVNNAQKLVKFRYYITNQEQRIRGHYSVTSNLGSSEYVEMILRDAVFIVELFIMIHDDNTDDFLLKPSIRFQIMVDLLLLENQIPYFVLDYLYEKAIRSTGVRYFPFYVLSLRFIYTVRIFKHMLLFEELPRVKHLTDLLRHFLVMEVPISEETGGNNIYDVPSATKLTKSGLNFKSAPKQSSWLDISLDKRGHRKWLPWFGVQELVIPCIEIYEETEYLLRNVMALEMFHYPSQTHICNYALLMDYLIDTVKDVDLLVEKGIIVNRMGDIEAIAKMFNGLCPHITLSDSCYYRDTEDMKEHYKYPWNHLKTTLKSVYFGDLWTGTATVAAALLLILTAIQTYCSVKQL